MVAMNGCERLMRTFRREPVEAMPSFSGMGMVLLPAIKKLGCKFPQVHTSAEKLARSGIESARMFNLDSVVMPYDMCWESEALDNKISLYEDSEDILYATIPNKSWTELDQVRIADSDIETIMTRGRTPLIPEAMYECGADAISVDIKNDIGASRKRLGNDVLLFGNFDVFNLPCKAKTTVEEAVAGMKANVDGGVDAVWPGCGLWPGIREENFRAMEETVRECGRKASPALGRLGGTSTR